MQKKLLLTFIGIIILCSPAYAEQFNLTSYYPAPSGNYNSIKLTPQTALTASNCTVGTLYANSSDNSIPYYCIPPGVNPLSTFVPFPGVWTLNANDLYLTDTSTPENKLVGIGTSTPMFKLTLANDGGILADNVSGSSASLPISGAGTRLIWYPAKGAFRAGYVPAAEWDDTNIGTYSMAMGYGSRSGSIADAVWGGYGNTTAVGGIGYNMIAGGLNNSCTFSYCQILGGESNSTTGINSTVAGKSNSAGPGSTIGGGENNTTSTNGIVSGGYSNAGSIGIISGGRDNTASATHSTAIFGGRQNSTGSLETTISGGYLNSIVSSVPVGTIAGGYSNNLGYYFYAQVSGGSTNQASGYNSVINGGLNNTIDGFGSHSTIQGGSNNTMTSFSSTITGGFTNTLSNPFSSIIGGAFNAINASTCTVAGQNMSVGFGAGNTFVWGHSATPIAPITTADTFNIYSGRMGIRDTTPAALLEINGNASTDDYLNLTSTTVAAAGNVLTIKNNGRIGVGQTNPSYPMHFSSGAYVDASGNFMPASSRIYKENIADLQLKKAMDAFSKLVPIRYNYINEKDQEYLGFISEDAPDLIASQDRKGLAPMDIAAVLTKVIAHQQDTLKKQKEESDALLSEVNELKSRVKNLKHME
ncbi:MAG: hypothetical protein H6754_00655 [Candidatus Omnitrophica bacterium]|nr:hypothetical protein [Candidatus Omnitrophota bacterium]